MVCSLCLAACSDDDETKDGPIDPVTEAKAEPFVGSVILKFKAPQSENYYYTLVTYKDSEGNVKHVKIGKDALNTSTGLMESAVTGFTDTQDHSFDLQACTAHGSRSSVVTVNAAPQEKSAAKDYVISSVTAEPGENSAIISWTNITGVPVNLNITYLHPTTGQPVTLTKDASTAGRAEIEILVTTEISVQAVNVDGGAKSEVRKFTVTPKPCPYDVIDPNTEYITFTMSCNQMAWVPDPDSPGNPYAYFIITTGGDPFCPINGLQAPVAGTKLVMRYKASKEFKLELFWCDKGGGAAGGRSTNVMVPKADSWTTFIYDYAEAMAQHNWKGNAGDFFRMDWGTEAALEIHVKNIHFE